MKNNNMPFIPVSIGTDITTYYWCVTMYEAYNVKTHLIGKGALAVTKYSSLVENIKTVDNFDDSEVFVEAMIDYADEIHKKYPGKDLVLTANNDNYTKLVIQNQEVLSEYYVMNVPSPELTDQIMLKENFYELADQYELTIPETIIYQMGDSFPEEEISQYPVIIKPSNHVEYFPLDFEGKQKIYYCKNAQELMENLHRIQEGGYTGKLIIQEYIPGDDTYMWDSVVYVNTKGKAQLVSLGQVALQEPESELVGNYTAIITRFDTEIMDMCCNFLEETGYRGFANFDFKRDPRDGQLKVFEINTRAGRGSFYVEQSGESLGQHYVEDILYDYQPDERIYVDAENMLIYVSEDILLQNISNNDIKTEVSHLIDNNKYGNPLHYSKDTSIRRKMYLNKRQRGYKERYANKKWDD